MINSSFSAIISNLFNQCWGKKTLNQQSFEFFLSFNKAKRSIHEINTFLKTLKLFLRNAKSV